MRIGKLSSGMNNSVVQALNADPFGSDRNASFFTNNCNEPLGMFKRKSTLRNQNSKEYRPSDTFDTMFGLKQRPMGIN